MIYTIRLGKINEINDQGEERGTLNFVKIFEGLIEQQEQLFVGGGQAPPRLGERGLCLGEGISHLVWVREACAYMWFGEGISHLIWVKVCTSISCADCRAEDRGWQGLH